MSAEEVKKIIGKAISDEGYRSLLLSSPQKALEGFDLTDDELMNLSNLSADLFNLDVKELEERISRWGSFGGNGI